MEINEVAEKHCGACHGAKGQNATPEFPKLAGQTYDYLVKQIKNFQSGLRRGIIMSAQLKGVSEPDVLALAKYFSNQRLTPSPPQDEAPDTSGQKIYAEGVADVGMPPCATCHGPLAHGKLEVPRLAGQHADYLAAQLIRFCDERMPAGQTSRHPPPIRLTEDEIDSVSDYLASLE